MNRQERRKVAFQELDGSDVPTLHRLVDSASEYYSYTKRHWLIVKGFRCYIWHKPVGSGEWSSAWASALTIRDRFFRLVVYIQRGEYDCSGFRYKVGRSFRSVGILDQLAAAFISAREKAQLRDSQKVQGIRSRYTK